MKFLVDAQLPRWLADFLNEQGQNAIHTLDLPDENRTSDSRINEISENEQRVVITKDADFVNSFLILSMNKHEASPSSEYALALRMTIFKEY